MPKFFVVFLSLFLIYPTIFAQTLLEYKLTATQVVQIELGTNPKLNLFSEHENNLRNITLSLGDNDTQPWAKIAFTSSDDSINEYKVQYNTEGMLIVMDQKNKVMGILTRRAKRYIEQTMMYFKYKVLRAPLKDVPHMLKNAYCEELLNLKQDAFFDVFKTTVFMTKNNQHITERGLLDFSEKVNELKLAGYITGWIDNGAVIFVTAPESYNMLLQKLLYEELNRYAIRPSIGTEMAISNQLQEYEMDYQVHDVDLLKTMPATYRFLSTEKVYQALKKIAEETK